MKNSLLFNKLIIFNIILIKTLLISGNNVELQYGNHFIGNLAQKDPAKYNDIIECPIKLFGVYPHPFNNEKYLKCVYGRLYEKRCSIGYVYSILTMSCEKIETIVYTSLPPTGDEDSDTSKVEMLNGSTFIKCPAKLIGTFVNPFYCEKYINCSPDGTRIRSCPSGEIYSFLTGLCGYEKNMKVQEHVECIRNNGKDNSEDARVLGVHCKPNGKQNYPHPTNSYKFVHCSNGKPQVKWCSKNTFFDVESLECIKESDEMEE